MEIKIIQGDSLNELKTLEDNSVDSIVTDPPYGLSFMGKHWDYDVPSIELWKEVSRVLKPGGHLLSFAGSRTYHRMAVAIEDAGFEIRDQIMWVYGSGFPKSHNIGKAVDKLQGNEREKVGEKTKTDFADIKEGDNKMFNHDGTKKIQLDITKGTSEWEGWGTGLKPAHEPICMARKPLAEKTVAENCLKYGTGGINIDESRVEYQSKEDMENNGFRKTNIQNLGKTQTENNTEEQRWSTGLKQMIVQKESGRFPANLIHDNSEEVRECFPNSKAGNYKGEGSKSGGIWSESTGKPAGMEYGDSGNASRFFKSIKTDELCTLCCLPFDIKHDTMSVCKNTNVSSAEKSLKTTQATTEVIAPQNAVTPDNKKFVQSVRSVANLCDLCGIYIAHVLVEGKPAHQEESALGQVFITEQKKQILDNVLASFVELRGKKDTTPTMNDLNLLFGFVFSAIENSTIYSDKESEVAKNHEWKSLLYQAKASKSERNKGCEGLEEKYTTEQNKWTENDYRKGEGEKTVNPTKNNHPTVKPIALMEYLIKMVTPKGGTVLDPFMGSGSTGVACKLEKFNFIGIEREEEYCKIAEARIKSVSETLL